MFIQNTFQNTLPVQQITLEEKRENVDKWGVSAWEKKCMDALEAIGRYQMADNMLIRENYELIRGRFNLEHYIDRNQYFDLASAITQEFNLPSHLKHYDITSKAVNVLVGEYLKRPDGFRVRAKDKDSTNIVLRAKTSMLKTYIQTSIQDEINKQLIQEGLDPFKNDFKNEEEANEYQQLIADRQKALTPPQIEKYLQEDYYTAAEQFGQHIIELDKERFNLKEKEAIEFEDMLVADRCFRHFYLTPTGYNQETWNPVNVFFHRSPEVQNVEDGDYVGRIFWLSKAQIIDRYGWLMKEEQIKALYPQHSTKKGKNDSILNEAFNASIYPFESYRDYMMQVNALGVDPHTGFPFNMNDMNQLLPSDINTLFTAGHPLNFRVTDIVMCTEGYWKSQIRIGKLNLEDPETGEVYSQIVDETFKPKLFGIKEVKEETFEDNNEPNTISWTWVTQVWKGVKLNVNFGDTANQDNDINQFNQRAMYINIKPNEIQFKGNYSPLLVSKHPVFGGIFNNRNGQSASLVDQIKPYQVFYNVNMNQAYEISQREIGKLILMDMNILPNLKDWGGGENFEKFLAVAKALGIGVVDTKATGAGSTTFASTNSYQVLDASETDRVAAKINVAMLIEQQAYKQLGITDARMGQIQASQTATGVEQSVNNSYSQTESYFEKFNNYKRRVLQANIEIAQFVYSKEEDITLNYTMSDLSRGFVKITDPDLLLRDLGVYPTFSQEITRQLETIRQLAIERNTVNLPMSALTKMLTMNSVKEIQAELKQAEDQVRREQEAQRQHEQQLAQQQIDAAAAEKEKDRQNENMNKQLDRENKIQIEALKGIANEGSYSPDTDTTGLLIEQTKVNLEKSKVASSNALAQQTLLNQQIDSVRKAKTEKEKLEKESKLKEKEAAHKMQIERQKLVQIQTQNKSQEKVNREANEAKLKLADKQIEIKAMEKKMKEAELTQAKQKSSIELEHIKKKTELEAEANRVKIKGQIELDKIKQKEAGEVSKVKIDEVKKKSKINIETTKKLARERIKQAAKPKPKN